MSAYKSKVWLVEGSKSAHCCFDMTMLLFLEPVDKAQAEDHSQWPEGTNIVFESWHYDEHGGDEGTQDLQACLVALRNIHDDEEMKGVE